MSKLYSAIYQAVKQIPPGKVSTYGQIARIVGNVRYSRVVGYAMAGCPDNSVPCHRVIRSTGELARSFGVMGNSLQRSLLEAEGVFVGGDDRVDLSEYLWDGVGGT